MLGAWDIAGGQAGARTKDPMHTPSRTQLIADHRARNRRLWAVLVAVGGAAVVAPAQELLLQEGFNTDGEAVSPKRYTMTGRNLYEPERIRSELNNFDQKGPIYWEHNFKVSYTGNPAIPARRAIFGWRGTDAGGATEDLFKLFDSTVDWLLAGKKAATVVIHPNIASVQGLADRLAAAGHTVVDDDIGSMPNEFDVPGDLFIHGPGSSNPSRFVLLSKPVIVMNAPDYDDMLVGSIGTSLSFDPGAVTVVTPGHPAAGGRSGSFTGFAGSQTFELVGSFLPTNAVTVATVTRVVPPSISSLADLEAAVTGGKATESAVASIGALDISDGSGGQWGYDNAVPGGYTGNWGSVTKGRLSVAKAGTYRFAVGSDDGASLRIDLDRNGLSATDSVLEDAGPHAHQIVYANVTFGAAGNYDFELRSYNSGGGGSVEASVAIVDGEIPDDDLTSGYWEVLGMDGAISPVKLSGAAQVTAYRAVGPDVQRAEPIVVVSSGPADNPPGSFYDGGPFSNHEGTGFLAAAGLNKWPYPDGQNYRSVTLRPVSVAGKKDVRLTLALAATVVDFEDSDFIDVLIHPKGPGSAPITLAHFRGVQNAIQPWLADQKQNFQRRLTRQFADFTYDIPADATDLVVEIRVATTWWTEIAAIDNVRVTAGAAASPATLGTPRLVGGDIVLSWSGGQAPYLVQWTPALGTPWVNLLTTQTTGASVPAAGLGGFFRIQSAASGVTARMFKAALSGAAESPAVDTPAVGAAILALNGDTLTYYVGYRGLKAVATASHIHGPAAAGGNAGVLFGLEPLGAYGTGGVLSGSVSLSAAQKAAIEGGQAYVNIHTPAHPGGEVRGQVTAVP